MEQTFFQKPPWKRVDWVSGEKPFLPTLFYEPWVSTGNEETLAIKEQIGALDKEHKWELAKKMVNPYELVYTHDDDRLPPSLSLEQPLSRSYFKMIEILNVIQFFENMGKRSTKFKTAHVAEGPGGFIQAVTLRGEMNLKVLTSSAAMTLKPNTAHVPGWKKATAFLHKYKHVRIHYGADGTGDIYKRENQDSFVETAGAQGATLFTADGGFDFSVDYSCQEQKVFELLVSSVQIGLRVLRQDGYLVLKLFDCNSPTTRLFITLLGRQFREWTLYKPAMTRPCNSERYFLGCGFRGVTPQILALLTEFRLKAADNLFPQCPGEWFTEAESRFFARHNEYHAKHQIQAILDAIELAKAPDLWWSTRLEMSLEHSFIWCEAFRLLAVPKNSYMVNLNKILATRGTETR